MTEHPSSSKRLQILDASDRATIYDRPHFSAAERDTYFTLTDTEYAYVETCHDAAVALSFVLNLGYFKAKQRFFTLHLPDLWDDVMAICDRYQLPLPTQPLRALNKRTRLKHYHWILQHTGYRICTVTERQILFQKAQQLARQSTKPRYLMRALIDYAHDQRIVLPGYSVMQEHIIGQALTTEQARLTALIQTHLSTTDRDRLNALLIASNGHYPLTSLRQIPKDFSQRAMRDEAQRATVLRPLYACAVTVLAQSGLSDEAMTEYAALVRYYPIARLTQRDPAFIHLALLCFVRTRYQHCNDHRIHAFLAGVKRSSRAMQDDATQQMVQATKERHHDVARAGQILALFTTPCPPETLFATVQQQAFTVLPPERLSTIADYLATHHRLDEGSFQWQYLDRHATAIKRFLRMVVRDVPLTPLTATTPLRSLLDFAATTFLRGRSLSHSPDAAIPCDALPVRDLRYLWQRTTDGTKHLLHDRYEFAVYRVLRNALEAGNLVCPSSRSFRSFEDDLISPAAWQQKAALLADVGQPRLLVPIREQLADLELQLESRLRLVNERIQNGTNTAITRHATSHRWTLTTPHDLPEHTDTVYDRVPSVSMNTLLHFVDAQCGFLAAFTHILGRYQKQPRDDALLRACLVAWGTNLGVGRMGGISDLSSDLLNRTSANFLRVETVLAANTCVVNALATMPIVRHYDLAGGCIRAVMVKNLKPLVPRLTPSTRQSILVCIKG